MRLPVATPSVGSEPADPQTLLLLDKVKRLLLEHFIYTVDPGPEGIQQADARPK